MAAQLGIPTSATWPKCARGRGGRKDMADHVVRGDEETVQSQGRTSIYE